MKIKINTDQLPELSKSEMLNLMLKELYKLKGKDYDQITKEELAKQSISLERQISDLSNKVAGLDRNIEILRGPKGSITIRGLVKKFLIDHPLEGKPKKLLIALSSGREEIDTYLIDTAKISGDSKKQRQDNLKQMISVLRNHFISVGSDNVFSIPWKNKELNSYKLVVNPNGLKINIKKPRTKTYRR